MGIKRRRSDTEQGSTRTMTPTETSNGASQPQPQPQAQQQPEERQEETTSPFMPMFEGFRAELDEHHDRRERIIKASRDVTAASKKIIFTLQRIRQIGLPLPPHVTKSNAPHHSKISSAYTSITPDLTSPLNTYRYARAITGGNQEWMEAASFSHYLTTGTLITFPEAEAELAKLGDEGEGEGEGGAAARLSVEDYLLGVFDMTGELMRFAVTAMATDGRLPTVPVPEKEKEQDGQEMDVDAQADSEKTQQERQQRDVLTDLRALRSALERLDVGKGNTSFARDVEKKMDVMQTSVEKVERALYGLVIRGRERPKGWMPDLEGSARREVEV